MNEMKSAFHHFIAYKRGVFGKYADSRAGLIIFEDKAESHVSSLVSAEAVATSDMRET